MTLFARSASVAALVSVVVACGPKPQSQQVEEIQKNAQQLAQNAAQISGNAQDVAKGFEAMARGMAAAATSAADVKPVDPVDFKELQSILPEVPGWERNHPEAERMTSPVSFSYASSKYTKDHFEVTAKITDSGFNQLLVALEGSGMSDNKELQAFLARTDLKKLAAMK